MSLTLNLDYLKDIKGNIKIDAMTFQKMIFLYNVINDGWNVTKKKDSYVFVKSHENSKEILSEQYISQFMNENLDINDYIVKK